MQIIKQDKYRSRGRGVSCSDDMVRVVVDMTLKEFEEFLAKQATNKPSKPCVHDHVFRMIYGGRVLAWCVDCGEKI